MKKMSSSILIIAIAVLAVLMTYAALNATVRPVQVVVAAQDLNAGTQLTSDVLQVKTVPRGGLPPGTFANVSDLAGKTLMVARVAGDPITSYTVGDMGAESGIPAMLDPNTVAIAVRVDQATGLAGVLRPGQLVTVIGVINPSAISQGQAGELVPTAQGPASASTPGAFILTPAPTATPQEPVSPAARVAVSGLKVLMVPQSFRYQEVAASSSSSTNVSAFSPAYTSSQAQNNNVILLEASIEPSEIAPGVTASPAEVLALLNNSATIHLVLEPAGGVTVNVNSQGVDLARLYEAITGLKLQP